jgi:hypothetical protein
LENGTNAMDGRGGVDGSVLKLRKEEGSVQVEAGSTFAGKALPVGRLPRRRGPRGAPIGARLGVGWPNELCGGLRIEDDATDPPTPPI